MSMNGSDPSKEDIDAWRKGTVGDEVVSSKGLECFIIDGAVYEREDGFICTYFKTVPEHGVQRTQYSQGPQLLETIANVLSD
jgi:hypothetical protein